MSNKTVSTIGLILIACMVVAAVVYVFSEEGVPDPDKDPTPTGVTINYHWEDQLIVDDVSYGSSCADQGMIYCVVAYTVHNGTHHNVKWNGYDVSLSIGNLSYGREYVKLDDGSWTIESGVTHKGVYTFEVPENHGDVSFSLGIGEKFDSKLPLSEIPEREAGQVYGILYHDISVHSSSISAIMYLKNVSYEDTLDTNSYNFKLEKDGVRISHSYLTYSNPSYVDMQYIPPGEKSELFVIMFEKPVGWDDESELTIHWDGYPKRGIQYTTDLTDLF